MKKFLKSLSLVMALVMCFTMVFTAAVSADGATPAITFGVADSVEPGAVTITVDAANFADVAGVQGEITVGGLTDAAVVAGTIDNVTIDAGVISFAREGEANDEGTKITMADGTLFTITGTAVEGTNITLAWTADETKACDTAEVLLDLDYADKTVEVKAPVVGPELDAGVQIGATLFIKEKYGWRFAVVKNGVAAYDHYELVVKATKYDDNYNLTTEELVFTTPDESTTAADFYYYSDTSAFELNLNVDLQVKLYDADNNYVKYSNVVSTSITAKALAAMPNAIDDQKTLYVDMVNNGAAAQAFFGATAPDSDLAKAAAIDAGFEDYQSYATADTDGITAVLDRNQVNTSYNIGSTVVVGASNDIRYNIVLPAADTDVTNLKARVTYTDIYNNEFDDTYAVADMANHETSAKARYFVYDKVALYGMGTRVNIELYEETTTGNVTLVTLGYSIDQFISDKIADATYSSITVPMAKFSYSARYFFTTYQ